MSFGSLILNLLSAVCALAAVTLHIRHSSVARVMKYFTALSNVFCAFACLAVAVFRLAGNVPWAILVLKYVGTVTVTLTMLTVLFFLMPQYGIKVLYGGADLWLHLLCPLMALLSYLCWDKPEMPFACVLLGLAPVALYGVVYLRQVVLVPEEKRWKDFYGFNKGGRWPVYFTGMITAGFLIAVLLWAL